MLNHYYRQTKSLLVSYSDEALVFFLRFRIKPPYPMAAITAAAALLA